jgi:hypothetical protein
LYCKEDFFIIWKGFIGAMKFYKVECDFVTNDKCFIVCSLENVFYLKLTKDTLKENDSSKSESHPVKYYLSKSLNVFGFKCT